MDLLPVDVALERVLELAVPLGPESVQVDEAVGRATVEPITATRTLPPWNNSAMDGYAVRTADLKAVPVELEVVETLYAGQVPHRRLEAGQAARIMTGARIPDGADAVVMQERCERLSDELVEVQEAPAVGANVREAGGDIREGAALLLGDTPLGIPEMAMLWAQGLQRVTVRRRPTVAIASSGDELCAPWEEPRGRIVDTNSPAIAQAVKRAGGIPTQLGVAADRLEAVKSTLQRGLSSDVLITVSGASVGDRDYTRQALEELGADLDFHGVAMKPGKPFAAGRCGDTLVFVLPGNPVSALVTFELFVRPALRALQGLPSTVSVVPGRAAVAVPRGAGKDLTHFIRASVELRDGQLWATPLATQSSGLLASVTAASHLLRVPPGVETIAAGSEVALIPVSWLA